MTKKDVDAQPCDYLESYSRGFIHIVEDDD